MGQPSAPITGGAPRPGRGRVLLAWALDRTGQKVHVSALDPRSRRERALFHCIGCGDPLIARLGTERAPHFAHQAGSNCPLTRAETALHLNAKEQLFHLCGEAFARRLLVRLRARCPACRREILLDLAALGDAAILEGAAGQLKVDVLITRDGAPSFGLEVRVTHALEPAKETALAAIGLPALEIDAREPWEEEIPGGRAIRVARALLLTRCPACAAEARCRAERAKGGEAAALAELEAYRSRGLLGPPPGPSLDAAPGFTAEERHRLSRGFRCPHCDGHEVRWSERIAWHACPRSASQPIAWRGYDGALVELAWWRAAR